MTGPWQSGRLPAPIADLRAYDPGHDLVAWRVRHGARLAELGSNENALGPSPQALAAAQAALAESHRYPDPRGGALKQALAARHGVEVTQIVLGNGSHELLMQVAQAFVPAGAPLVYSQFGFAVFAIAAAGFHMAVLGDRRSNGVGRQLTVRECRGRRRCTCRARAGAARGSPGRTLRP